MARDQVIKIRNQDASARLCAAGASWVELRDSYAIAGSVIACTGVVALALGIASAGDSYAQRSGAATGLLVVAGFLIVAGVVLWATMRCRRRAVVFQLDGVISTPHGLPGYEGWRAVEGNHAGIVSIESRLHRGEYIVVIVSYEGDQVWVSQNLTQDRALKVAVQLSRALSELRSAQAAGARQRAAAQPALF